MNKKNVPVVTECSIWFLNFFQKLAFECNTLRIEVDCTKSRSYVEIDAIKITGTTDSYQPVVNDLQKLSIVINVYLNDNTNVERPRLY
jgi:hypothetical protein